MGVTGISPAGIPRDSSNGRTLLQFGANDAASDVDDEEAEAIVAMVEPCTTVGTVDDNPWPAAIATKCIQAKNVKPAVVLCGDIGERPLDNGGNMVGVLYICLLCKWTFLLLFEKKIHARTALTHNN